MGPRKEVAFQLFSCYEDGNDDFQTLYMLQMKLEVAFPLVFCFFKNAVKE